MTHARRHRAVRLPVLFLSALVVAVPRRFQNAYAAVYSHDVPDRDERFLATRVMIRSLQVTRPQADVVVLVSASTPSSHRAVFESYGCKVVPIADRASWYSSASAPVKPKVFQKSSTRQQQQQQAQSNANDVAASPGELQAAMQGSVYARKCSFNRDFIYLWTLTQYHRVVYIEADTLVFRNLDDLFKCGHFCMVFANENCWNSGFLVLKPDLTTFRRWTEYFWQKSETLDRGQQQAWIPPTVSCATEYYNSLLDMFPSIESAPLFYARDGPQSAPVMRVNLLYCVNAIFFYEHFTWILYRLNLPLATHGGAYDPALYRMIDASNKDAVLNQSLPTPFQWGIPNDVPAFSLSFVHPHPWTWWEASFFDLNWWWHDTRALLIPETNADVWMVLVSRLSALLLTLYVGEKLMARFFTPRFREQSLQTWERVHAYFVQHAAVAAGMSVTSAVDYSVKGAALTTQGAAGSERGVDADSPAEDVSLNSGGACRIPVTPRFRAAVRGTFLGCIAVVFAALIARPFVPAATPPAVAWPLFCLWHNYLLYVIIKLALNFFPFPEPPVAYEEPRVTAMLAPFLISILTLVHNRSDLYNHFVKKILGFLLLGAAILLVQTGWFRKMSVTRYELKAGVYGSSDGPLKLKVKTDGDHVKN